MSAVNPIPPIVPEREGDRLQPLTRDECLELLRGRSVGRVAYTDHALPTITPVNYAVSGESLVFRTATSSGLAEGTRDAVVAFEVDDTDELTRSGWSVVVVGVASELTRSADIHRALELNLESWAGDDRGVFVRITPTYVTGRVMSPVSPGRS